MKIYVQSDMPPFTKLPSRSTKGSAGLDIFSLEESELAQGETILLRTGLKMAIPAGTVGFVCSRSGLALKEDIFVLNAPGVYDEDYRGELKVILHRIMTKKKRPPYEIKVGDKVSQFVLVPVVYADVVPVDDLDKTDRGEGGFGSTGR